MDGDGRYRGMICIAGLTWAQRHKREFDAVLTIEDPGSKRKSLRFHRTPHPDHLILRFYDLDYPIPDPYHRPWMRLATREDVVAALAFAQNRTRLLIHCRAGVSRSTAIALAILTDRLQDPRAALAAVIELRAIAVPNRHITALADDVLGCAGKLLETLDQWDHLSQSNATRRRLCRVAHLYEFGLPLTGLV